MESLEAACEILEKHYETCEVVKLDTEDLKHDGELSDMRKNELLNYNGQQDQKTI